VDFIYLDEGGLLQTEPLKSFKKRTAYGRGNAMAVVTRGQTFSSTETITNTKLHNLVDLATVSNIVDADLIQTPPSSFRSFLASSMMALY